jgi:hypothetical protein
VCLCEYYFSSKTVDMLNRQSNTCTQRNFTSKTMSDQKQALVDSNADMGVHQDALTHSAEYTVEDVQGNKLALKELWSEKTTIVMFIRHFL